MSAISGPNKRRPTTSETHLGIEFEFDLPSSEAWKEMQEALSPIAHFVEIFREDLRWSNEPNYMGYEATILTPQDEYKPRLKRLLDFLEKHPTFVDERCGYHLHFDLRAVTNRSRRTVTAALRDKKEQLYSLCHPRRRTGSHSGPTNLLCNRGYETVELRCHEATFDYEKLTTFTDYAIGVVEAAPRMNREAAHPVYANA